MTENDPSEVQKRRGERKTNQKKPKNNSNSDDAKLIFTD